MATRASDHERESCARELRDHAAAGRIEIAELEERLSVVYGARYRTELRAALRDLPRQRMRAAGQVVDRLDRALLWLHASLFVLCAVALVLLWALFGGGEFWPAWMLVPWLIVLSWHVAGSWGVRRMLRRRAAGELRPSAHRRRLVA
jgi:hypothetical protein